MVVVGFPHDEGVRRNGGRVGAAGGPACVRKFLPKMGAVVNPERGVDLRQALDLYDAGDVGVGEPLEAAHEALRALVAEIVGKGLIPFVIGGGNDQSYPNAAGALDALADRDG